MLPYASVHLDCLVYRRIDAGDRGIILGEVVAYDHGPETPFAYCRGQFFKAQEPDVDL